MKVNLGKIEVSSGILLAPVAGFTDSPFRRIARRHGAGLVVTELVSAEGIVRKNRKTEALLKFHADERPLAIQIFGKDPSVMAHAAAVVGEYKPDLIDLNMGCPSPKICNAGNGSGAALLLHPDKIEAIAKAVVQSVKIPVSAKIRIGWDEKNKNFLEVIKALEQGGISLVFVHGRTRSQYYGGTADWDAIRAIREESSIPVVGNGDIGSLDEAQDRINSSGCPAVMIGRAALGNPWIFCGTKPSIREIVDQAKEHLGMMLDFYGERGLILMRKHFVKYVHAVRNASKIRSRLVTSTQRDEINDLLDTLKQDAI